MNIKKKSFTYKFFKSEKVDIFIFCVFLATIFTAGLCNSILDNAYKYSSSQIGKAFYVDFGWVFWLGTIVSLFYLIRDYLLINEKIY